MGPAATLHAQHICNTLTQVPGAAFPTSSFGFGINNTDTSVGVLSGPLASISRVAFAFSNGVFKPVSPVLSGFPQSTAVYGINDSNRVVGSTSFTGASFSFVCTALLTGLICDDVTVIAFPEAGSTTVPHGINNAGDIVGTYSLNGVSHGFIDIGGMYQMLDAPGATGGTIAWGINNLGQVVGQYTDATGTHGFLATPIRFAGTPGFSNCHGQSVAALTQQFGGLNAAAAALGFPSVQALQNAIKAFCQG
jgi:hypothetical protein